jgi:hypothetical protein
MVGQTGKEWFAREVRYGGSDRKRNFNIKITLTLNK